MNQWDFVRVWVAQRRKALAALIVSIGVAAAARHGLAVSSVEIDALNAALVAFIVYLVPNEAQ